jgi:hypothetical protein
MLFRHCLERTNLFKTNFIFEGSTFCLYQGAQIGRNFAIWAIFYGVGQIFFLEKVAQ